METAHGPGHYAKDGLRSTNEDMAGIEGNVFMNCSRRGSGVIEPRAVRLYQ
jgi:hypothetical protein